MGPRLSLGVVSAPRPNKPRRFVIDPGSCGVCSKSDDGLRCSQPITQGYERALVRAEIARRAAGGGPRQRTAPCGDACPLSLCVQGYAKHIAAGEYAEALGHIMERTALPESVCRVCDRPCESACSTSHPVAINDLKRFVVDWAAKQDGAAWTPPQEERHGRTVAVVGAGPSGLAAAKDLALRGYDVTLFDGADRAGGLLAHCIPSYRLPREAVERDVETVLSLGVTFVGGMMLGRDRSLEELLEEGHEAVILAFGAHRSRRLELQSTADAPEVVDALGFLKALRAGRGAPLDGDVVVIGGGDAAVDAARSALRLGAYSVAMACLESRAEMPAFAEQLLEAEEEGVAVHTQLKPVRLETGAAVFEGLGPEAPGDVRLAATLVITAIGQEPDLSAIKDTSELATTTEGLLDAEEATGRTSHPRVFAAGDLVQGPRTVTHAMAAGLRVAWAVDGMLRGAESADARRPPPLPRVSDANGKPLRGAPLARATNGAARAAHTPAESARTFDEIAQALSEAAARDEAERCTVCGHCGNCRTCADLFGCPALVPDEARVSVDADLCNGCGVCPQFCTNGAIRPEATP